MAAAKRWLVLLRIPIALAGVLLFFSLYNRFLLDANLRNLKNSLTVLDAATGVGQAEAALLLVDQTLVAEMAKEELDLASIGVLQYAQGALSGSAPDRLPVDAQAMLGTLTQEREAAQAGPRAFLGAVSSRIERTISGAGLFPRGRKADKAFEEINPVRLSEAIGLERAGSLDQAAAAYRGLIADYPNYAGRGTLKLRLGAVLQRLGRPDEAQRLYREALKEEREPKEISVARALLESLASAQKLQASAQKLERRLPSLGSGPERQEALFRLGSLRLQLSSLEKAAQAFREAALADPEGELARPSLFKQAWCLKRLGRLREAFGPFQEIVRREPAGSWAAAARQQMAEIYKAQGAYAEALKMYDELIAQSKDDALVALALAQAGATAMYDLRDSVKALAYFEKLSDRFPASSFSGAGDQMKRLEADKAALLAGAASRSLGAGSPFFGWVRKVLPAFVQTFAEKLARYMDSVGETELHRNYTEEEFRKIVLRRVQELFPNQIQGVEVHIHADGYRGSCTARLGPLRFPLEGWVSIKVVNQRPHVVPRELRVWGIQVPKAILDQIGKESNRVIDGLRLPIRVHEYTFSEGYVTIRVERVV